MSDRGAFAPRRARSYGPATMSLYDRVIPLYLHLLPQVSVWLDKAIAHAEKKRFDPEILFSARLAPDQFAFAKQVQSACDTANSEAASTRPIGTRVLR